MEIFTLNIFFVKKSENSLRESVETYTVYIHLNEMYVKRADGLTQFDFCHDIVMLSFSNKSMQQLFCLSRKYVPKFGII